MREVFLNRENSISAPWKVKHLRKPGTRFQFIPTLSDQRLHSGFIIYIMIEHVNPVRIQGLTVEGHVQAQNKKQKSLLQIIYV